MLRADKDVRLVNGEGYMVEENEYQKHLKSTIEQKEVSICFVLFFFRLSYTIKFIGRNPSVLITRLSEMQMLFDKIWKQLELVPVHVHDMGVSFRIL